MGGRGSGRKVKRNIERVGRPIGTKFVSVKDFNELKENAESYIASQAKAHRKALWIYTLNGIFMGALFVAMTWNNPTWITFLLGGVTYALFRWVVE
jgi:hypothetical protein